MRIDAHCECGNIEVLKLEDAHAELAIRPDAPGRWRQWFDFRILEAGGRDLTLRIVNAGDASYVDGWVGYRACVDEDGQAWIRTETTYRDGVLEVHHRPW